MKLLLKLPPLLNTSNTEAQEALSVFTQKLLKAPMDERQQAQLVHAWLSSFRQSPLAAWQSFLGKCSHAQVLRITLPFLCSFLRSRTRKVTLTYIIALPFRLTTNPQPVPAQPCLVFFAPPSRLLKSDVGGGSASPDDDRLHDVSSAYAAMLTTPFWQLQTLLHLCRLIVWPASWIRTDNLACFSSAISSCTHCSEPWTLTLTALHSD